MMPQTVEPRQVLVSEADLLAWQHRLSEILLDYYVPLEHDGTLGTLLGDLLEARDWFQAAYQTGTRVDTCQISQTTGDPTT